MIDSCNLFAMFLRVASLELTQLCVNLKETNHYQILTKLNKAHRPCIFGCMKVCGVYACVCVECRFYTCRCWTKPPYSTRVAMKSVPVIFMAWAEYHRVWCQEHLRFVIPQNWSLDDDVALIGMLSRSIYIACCLALRFICDMVIFISPIMKKLKGCWLRPISNIDCSTTAATL